MIGRCELAQQSLLAQYELVALLIKRGMSPALPCDPWSVYDLLVDVGTRILRLQVKSCNVKKRNRYRVDIACGSMGRKRAYCSGSIDFFVVSIPNEGSWYVIPQSDVNGQHWVSLYPHDRRGKYEKYRDAWSLMASG